MEYCSGFVGGHAYLLKNRGHCWIVLQRHCQNPLTSHVIKRSGVESKQRDKAIVGDFPNNENARLFKNGSFFCDHRTCVAYLLFPCMASGFGWKLPPELFSIYLFILYEMLNMHDAWWAPPMALHFAAWYLNPWIARASELPLEEQTFGNGWGLTHSEACLVTS